MMPVKLVAFHDKKRVSIDIENDGSGPVWTVRDTKGNEQASMQITRITKFEVSILESGRVALLLHIKDKTCLPFVSVGPADLNWQACLAVLRDASRRSTRRRRIRFSKVFPPIEYLIHDETSTRTSDATASASRKRAQHLFDLPQEILDIIFDYAYPAQEGLRIVTESVCAWTHKLRVRRGDTSHAQQKFTPKVNEFFVSKRFFKEASTAWVKNQHFAADDSPYSTGALHKAIGFDEGSLIGRYATKLTLDYQTAMSHVTGMPSLVDLTIRATVHVFESLEPKLAWEVAFGKEDFEVVLASTTFKYLRGLKRLRMIPEDTIYANTPKQKRQWKENVLALSAFLVPFVTRPRKSTVSKHRSLRDLPVQRKEAPRKGLGTNPFPGVLVTKFGLLITPRGLEPDRYPQVQEFVQQNLEAIASSVATQEVNLELAAMMAKLKLD